MSALFYHYRVLMRVKIMNLILRFHEFFCHIILYLVFEVIAYRIMLCKIDN